MLKQISTISFGVLGCLLAAIAVTIFLLFINEVSLSIDPLDFSELVLFFLVCICFFPTSIVVSYFFLYKVSPSLVVYLNKRDVLFSMLIALPCNV